MKLRAMMTVSSEEVGEGLWEGVPGNGGEGQNSLLEEEAMEVTARGWQRREREKDGRSEEDHPAAAMRPKGRARLADDGEGNRGMGEGGSFWSSNATKRESPTARGRRRGNQETGERWRVRGGSFWSSNATTGKRPTGRGRRQWNRGMGERWRVSGGSF